VSFRKKSDCLSSWNPIIISDTAADPKIQANKKGFMSLGEVRFLFSVSIGSFWIVEAIRGGRTKFDVMIRKLEVKKVILSVLGSLMKKSQ